MYKWVREDKEEFFTDEYDAEGNPIYDVPSDVEFNLFSENLGLTELENPIEAQKLAPMLHSQLRIPFYLSLCEAQEREIQSLLNEAMKLANIYNTELFLGSEAEFKSRVTNVTTLLGFDLPLFFADKLGAPVGINTLTDRIKWLQELLTSVYILRRWSGSSLGYRTLFKFIKKRGSLFLRAQYKFNNFNSETDKYYRIVSAEHLSENSVESLSYPLSKRIRGEEDYATAKLRLIQFDTKLVFDKTGENSPPTKFDAPAGASGETTKGLSLEVGLEELLYHNNSIQSSKCLLDNDWLKAMSIFLKTVKKASDKVSIGSQLSLTALSNGRYSKYPLGSTEEDIKKYLFTHPNIEAKFQVFPNYYDATTEFSYIQIGKGSYNEEVFNASDTSNYEVLLKEYPTKLKSPLFQTSIGFNERGLLGKYKVISSTIHNQKFSEQNINLENIKINKQLTQVKLFTDIEFPHPSLAPGSLYFNLRIPSPDGNLDNDRYFYIYQTYNELLNIYDSEVTIKKPILIKKASDLVLKAEELLTRGLTWENVLQQCQELFFLKQPQLDKLKRVGTTEVTFGEVEEDLEEVVYLSLQEISDKAYSILVKDSTFFRFEDQVQDSFLQSDVDSFVLLESIPGKFNSRGYPIYADIDTIKGSIRLRISYNIQNSIGLVYGGNQSDIDNFSSSGKVAYEINSLRSYASRQQFDEGSNRVAITELGIFDKEDIMVAYATFPPIIYDASKYHTSYNLLLDTTPLIEDPPPLYLQKMNWTFNSLPEIPDNISNTYYIQDSWADSDGWELGQGSSSLMVYEGSLLIQGTGSYIYHNILRDVSPDILSSNTVRLKLKYNPYISSIRIRDGGTLYSTSLYRDGDFLLSSYILKNNISQLNMYIYYTSTLRAASEISEINWIYVGDDSYSSVIEDETAWNIDGIINKAFKVKGAKGDALAFTDPQSYIEIIV